MHAYTVHVDVIDDNQRSVEKVSVEAEYYTEEGQFITFKDAEHKQVASFNSKNVVSVVRAERKTSIGTAVVNIVPRVDAEAMNRTIEEIERRLRRLPSTAR